MREIHSSEVTTRLPQIFNELAHDCFSMNITRLVRELLLPWSLLYNERGRECNESLFAGHDSVGELRGAC